MKTGGRLNAISLAVKKNNKKNEILAFFWGGGANIHLKIENNSKTDQNAL